MIDYINVKKTKKPFRIIPLDKTHIKHFLLLYQYGYQEDMPERFITINNYKMKLSFSLLGLFLGWTLYLLMLFRGLITEMLLKKKNYLESLLYQYGYQEDMPEKWLGWKYTLILEHETNI